MGLIKSFYESNLAVQKAARLILDREESLRLFECGNPLGTKRQLGAAEKWLYRIDVCAKRENILLCEEAEVLALQKGVHVLGSHRFAMSGENKSSFVRVPIASPDMETELRKGLRRRQMLEKGRVRFFV